MDSYKIMSAEYFHNPYAPNTTQLYDLNDDCVLEIFARLSVLDLCAIRNTCKRFDALAEYFFNMVYKSLNLNNYNIVGEYRLLSEDEARTILTTFGKQIDSLKVNADSFASESNQVLQIIDEYCGDRKFQSFKMIKFVIDEDTVDRCSRLWANIEQLTIDKCYADDDVIEKLLRKCSALTHLEMIRQMNIDGRCFLHEFPRLQGFSLRSSENFDPVCINTFLQKNPQLKTLSIISCNFVDDEIFEIIADSLINLETLHIRVVHVTSAFETNINNLLKLQHLRKLEFNCNLRPIVSFVTGLAMTNRIESLGISSAELTPELASALCNLKNLQVLKLISMYDGNLTSIKTIAQQLPRLQELHLIECDIFDFGQVLEFVENALKLEKLVIVQCSKIIPFNGEKFTLLAQNCSKRVDKIQLSLQLDYYELKLTKELISEDLRREYSHILQLVSLSWEDNFKTGAVSDNLYFAEEGGAYDYEQHDYDTDDDDNEDDYEVNDPYNVWNDDFDDEDLYPF